MPRLAALLFFLAFAMNAQTNMISYKDKSGEYFKLKSGNAPFPHKMRENGHTYNNDFYSAEDHYSDNSVLLFVPNGFTGEDETNFVVYFHGWYNNIDSSLTRYNLIEQFAESGLNAVFILPEGPKNAPDSFGGKLEEVGVFKNLINEIITFMHDSKLIKEKKSGKIILAGHSGAYRVISFILMRGGLTEDITGVVLFDGLYGQLEKFAYWIDNYKGKFINIFTETGGTKELSENLAADLDGWKIPYLLKSETNLTGDEIAENRILFIRSDLDHNGVISQRSQFRLFLSSFVNQINP